MSSASRDRRESRGSHGESDDDDDDSTDLDDENYHEVAEKRPYYDTYSGICKYLLHT